ncbi:MAG: periplasmic heavy metal sensor [Pseudomonadota bacterium]
MSSTPPQHNRSRWVLIASLSLNVLLIAAIAGAVLNADRHQQRAPGLPPIVKLISDALPEEARDALRVRLRDEFGRTGFGNRRGAARGEGEVVTLLAADTLDEAALRDALNRQRSQITSIYTLASESLVAELVAMPQADRQALAERLRQALVERLDRRNGPRKGDAQKNRSGPPAR